MVETMIETASSTVCEFVASLGLEAGMNHFKNKADEHKLRTALEVYIKEQEQYNELCALAEEIDFQGLVEYIDQNFADDLEKRFFAVKKEKRGIAFNEIVEAAIVYSKAEKPEAKKRVSKCIAICLNIVRKFYKDKISKKEYILAAEVVDAVVEPISEQLNDVRNVLSQKIDSFGKSNFSLDSFVKEVKVGNYKSINSNLKTIFHVINQEHPLNPDYGFAFDGEKLVSTPLSNDAIIKHPPKYRFTGRVKIGNQYIDDPSVDLFDYAYRHQLVLTMDVTEAKKYLGEIEDPAWFDTGKVAKIRAYPPAFPPAFPCEIRVKDKVYFETVWMRTCEVEDDGTIVINNHEQTDTPYRVEFRMNINEFEKQHSDINGDTILLSKNAGFMINIHEANNEEHLEYVKFMKALSEECDLSVLVKEAGKSLIAGKISNVNYPTGFDSIDEEIEFLERICDIERYFNVRFTIDKEIDGKTISVIMHISDLIRKEEVSHTWSEACLTGIVDENFRTRLLEVNGEEFMFSYVCTVRASFFNAQINYEYMCTYKNAIIVDYERIKELVKLLNDGDPIKIVLRPGKNNIAIETLNVPKNNEDLVEF